MNDIQDYDDETFMTQAQIIQRRDEKIARLEGAYIRAVDEIDSMRRDMAASLPDVSACIDVSPTYRPEPGIIIDGPRQFRSMMPLWSVPKGERAYAKDAIVREAARMHLEAVYSKILKAVELIEGAK